MELIEKGETSDLEGLAPRLPLTLEEQSAIIGFTERTPRMSSARVEELADILSPWLDKAKLKQGRESAAIQLSRIAKWLRGHQ